MSFIKKGLKKVWNFVKDYWKEIVMVAAVVFTAGIATVGVAGFSAAMAAGGGGVGGFFSAVGSTMWAGVTATAGSMGIGQGAAVGQGTAFAGANIAGGASHVGLGAAMGAGQGYGLGAAGKAAAAEAAALESAAQSTGVLMSDATSASAAADAAKVAKAAEVGTPVSETMTELVKASAEGTAKSAAEATVPMTEKATKAAMHAAEAGGGGGGMSLDTALKVGAAVGPGIATVGQALLASGDDKVYQSWGVPTAGKQAKGYDYEQHFAPYDQPTGPLMVTAEQAAQEAGADAVASTRSPAAGVMDMPMGGYEGGQSLFDYGNRNLRKQRLGLA